MVLGGGSYFFPKSTRWLRRENQPLRLAILRVHRLRVRPDDDEARMVGGATEDNVLGAESRGEFKLRPKLSRTQFGPRPVMDRPGPAGRDEHQDDECEHAARG